MGADKAFLKWDGEPLWQIQLSKLLRLDELDPVLVASRPEQQLRAVITKSMERQAVQRIRYVDDPPGDDSGPLGAVARCLEVVEPGQALVVLGVDLPCLSGERLQWLADASHGGRGMFLIQANRMRTEAPGKTSPVIYEPLAARYTTAMLPLLRAALAERRLSLQAVIRHAVAAGLAAVIDVPTSEQAEFRNLNRPEDLDAATEAM